MHVSVTVFTVFCRDPRPGEEHGKHYFFTDKDSMAAQVAAGMFLEHANVHGNM